MGNIRPTYIKRVAAELLEKFPEEFEDDFEHNKVTVEALSDVQGKVLRNRIAGYITRRIDQGALEDKLEAPETTEEPTPEAEEDAEEEAGTDEEPARDTDPEDAVELLEEESGVEVEADEEPAEPEDPDEVDEGTGADEDAEGAEDPDDAGETTGEDAEAETGEEQDEEPPVATSTDAD